MENEQAVEVLPPEDRSQGPFLASDMELLDENRKLKRLLIKELTKGGKLPDENSDRNALLTLMASLDSEIIARTRVKVQAKTDEAMANVTAMVSQALLQHRTSAETEVTDDDLAIPSSVERVQLVPGQADIGNIPLKLQDLT